MYALYFGDHFKNGYFITKCITDEKFYETTRFFNSIHETREEALYEVLIKFRFKAIAIESAIDSIRKEIKKCSS